MTPPVVLLGADGFIGRHIAFALRARGIAVRAVARRTEALEAMGFDAHRIDLTDTRWHRAQAWAPVVADGAHVINAAGLLNGSEEAFEAVHVKAPAALYEAMAPEARGVLISAIGIETDTDFAHWRRAGEKTAKGRLTILRPGLVMADTSYGGTSLARALASLPGVVPVVGSGEQPFNPIHAEDLADIAVHCLGKAPLEEPVAVGGPEQITQEALAQSLRGWMGLPKARVLRVPEPVARVMGTIGDILKFGPISATSVAQLKSGVLAPMAPELADAPAPRGIGEMLEARPAGTQDIWHARLYLLKPLLRLTLAFMWLISGILGLVLPGSAFLPGLTVPDWMGLGAARIGGLIDLGIAAALIANWRPRLTGLVQLGMVGAYTLGLTLMAPALWMLPFGGLLKNLPVFALIGVWMILERER